MTITINNLTLVDKPIIFIFYKVVTIFFIKEPGRLT